MLNPPNAYYKMGDRIAYYLNPTGEAKYNVGHSIWGIGVTKQGERYSVFINSRTTGPQGGGTRMVNMAGWLKYVGGVSYAAILDAESQAGLVTFDRRESDRQPNQFNYGNPSIPIAALIGFK